MVCSVRCCAHKRCLKAQVLWKKKLYREIYSDNIFEQIYDDDDEDNIRITIIVIVKVR